MDYPQFNGVTVAQAATVTGAVLATCHRLSLRNRLCMIPLVQLRKEDTDIVACLQAGMFVRRRGEKDCEEAF